LTSVGHPTNTTLESFLEKFSGVVPTGHNKWKALCPSHDDHNPSLSIGYDPRTDSMLVHCHAGCDTREVLAAAGLTNSDLYLSKKGTGAEPEIVTTYDYTDEKGLLLFQVVRYQPKSFRQRRPGGDGNWIWNLKGVRRVLYRLPKVIAAVQAKRTIYLCEGEKDVHTLENLGLDATTNPMGAKKWSEEYSKSLAGADVVFVGDNDTVGEGYAREVCRCLQKHARTVRAVHLPKALNGDVVKDVSDWVAAGGTREGLEGMAETAETGPTVDESMFPAEHDLAHAETLMGRLSGRLKWAVHRQAWRFFSGHTWKPLTEAQAVMLTAKELRKAYISELARAEGKVADERYTSLLKATNIHARMQGALNFVRGHSDCHTDASDWDSDPYRLNVANGILDLKTGELYPHGPEHLYEKQAPVAYDPATTCPLWEAHIQRFLPNPNVRRQVQRDLGRALVGATLEEVLDMWLGTGANGKTTSERVVAGVLGPYATKAAPNLLIASKNERHSTEVADLCGSRVVFATETDAGKHLNEALLKELTGGGVKKARYLYGQLFEFPQTFSITLITNHQPAISGADEGIWRRVRLIPWEYAIPEPERRPQDEVVAELLSQGSGILNWLIAGLRDWEANTHWVAQEVLAATQSYRAEQDALAEFLTECCEFRPRATTTVAQLYDVYTEWCRTADEEPLSKKVVSQLLKQRGLTASRGRAGARLWQGIRTTVTGGDSERQLPYAREKIQESCRRLSPCVTNLDSGFSTTPAEGQERCCPECGCNVLWDTEDGSLECGSCKAKIREVVHA